MDLVVKYIELLSAGDTDNLLPPEPEAETLCTMAADILAKEPNVVLVSPPVTVVGDIHGQYFDLLELFHVGGTVPEVNYVFMGDYVDRGFHSLESWFLLMLLKIKYPRRVTLIRGNHESRQITQVYGFYDECLRKYGSPKIWHMCTDVFDCLPLSVVVGEKVFCVHAGLSPDLKHVEDIRTLDRRQEMPREGLMADLMWSDPTDATEGWACSERGAGYLFGIDIADKFNHENGYDLITRSHQLVMEGYKERFNGALVTVWSAPNYCYRCGNVASILELDETLATTGAGGERTYKIFTEAPERNPDLLPGTMPSYFL
eukprot:PhM_4_TR484/c0_g1_i1/m.61084/K15423/PPP4C; serine/threonine-protein phosphatase 4 catalytic subunit